MSDSVNTDPQSSPSGVMLNAYPDSIGTKLADTVAMLQRSDFKDVFSLLYILPTIFHSDLDRGFSIIDYDLNEELVTQEDLDALRRLNIRSKLDLVVNHLSVGSPQFRDLLERGDGSPCRNFFIDWNEFWAGHGEMGDGEHIIPREEYLQKLFMRKPGLPILDVRFPDGTMRPYWNTFYQEIRWSPITAQELQAVSSDVDLSADDAQQLADELNASLKEHGGIDGVALGVLVDHAQAVKDLAGSKRSYLGQMDLNANSDSVWEFYDETMRKLRSHGGQFVRLDAFAYLHKAPGESNFFNKPGTWEYLDRLKQLARNHGLVLVPEIHSQYGTRLHEEVASEGFRIYDFFLPGLVIDALDRGVNKHLVHWIREVESKGIQTINMLGCHDGIPVLDLKGIETDDGYREGLLSDDEIEAVIERILERGGRVKNLYGDDGKKISYYQVNATFFSALGEDERKLLLARAIQMFMPGVPQVWYLDLFAGCNDYAAADRGGTGGHKEINRTTLSLDDIDDGLSRPVVQDQLALMRLRNTSTAFAGELTIGESQPHELQLTWKNKDCTARLTADLTELTFCVTSSDGNGNQTTLRHPEAAAVEQT